MKIKYVFFIAVLTVLFFQPLKVNAAENQYLELYYEFGLREDTSQIYDGWYYSDWDGLQSTCVFDNNYTYALLRSDYVKNNVTVGYTYTIYCGTIGGSYSSPYVSTNNSVSAVPIKQYYRNSDDVPNGKYTNVPTDICTWNTELYPDLLPATEYSYMYISHNTNLPIFTNTSDLANYYATGDKSGQIVDIDWDNMQYNETIDYLQNVMLKSTDFKERNFEITWSNNNGQYMSDEWHVQIGWNTKFQKELFGDVYNWTNLEYVTWLDNLNYSEGKWTGNFDTMYSEIPECNYRSWWGSIYLRLVRVDSNTGSVEYGGWGQLSWAHKDDYGLTANYKTIKYANSLDKPGVSESESYQYIEDTEHKSSQSYVINTGNGTIDSVSTSVTNGILDETGSIDLEKATNYFVSGIDGLLSVVDSFPRFIGKVFSFLPSEITVIFSIGLIIALLCRLGGR